MKQSFLFGRKPTNVNTLQFTPKRKRDEDSLSETNSDAQDGIIEEDVLSSNSPARKKLKFEITPTPQINTQNTEDDTSVSTSTSSTPSVEKIAELDTQIQSKLEFLKNGKNYATDLFNDDTTKTELQTLHEAVKQNKTDIFVSDKQFPDIFVPLLCKLIQDSSKSEDDLVTFIYDTCFSNVQQTLQIPSRDTLRQQITSIAKRENYGGDGEDESLQFWIWEVKNVSNLPKKIKSMLKDRRTERKECKKQVKQWMVEKQKFEKLKLKEEKEKEKEEKKKKEKEEKKKEKVEEKKKLDDAQQKEEEKKKKPVGLSISKFLKVKSDTKKQSNEFVLPYMNLSNVDTEEVIQKSIETQNKDSSSTQTLLQDAISVLKQRCTFTHVPSATKIQFGKFCKEKQILDPTIKCFKFEIFPLYIGTRNICSMLMGKLNSKKQYVKIVRKLSKNPFQKAYSDETMDDYYENMCFDEEYAEGEALDESLDGEEEKEDLVFDEEEDDGFLVAEGYLSDEEMMESDDEEENRTSSTVKKTKEELLWNPTVVGPIISQHQFSTCTLQAKTILEPLRSVSMVKESFQISFDDDKVNQTTQQQIDGSSATQEKKKRYLEIDHTSWKQFIETEDLKTMVLLAHGSALSKDSILAETCQQTKSVKICNRAAAKRQFESIALKEKRDGESIKLYYVNNDVLLFLKLDSASLIADNKKKNEEERKKQQESVAVNSNQVSTDKQ